MRSTQRIGGGADVGISSGNERSHLDRVRKERVTPFI